MNGIFMNREKGVVPQDGEEISANEKKSDKKRAVP